MPASDVPERRQKGVIKGLVSGLETLKGFNFATYCPFVTITNMPAVPFAGVMNGGKWYPLSSDVKKVIKDLRREQGLWTGKYHDDYCIESAQWSKEKYRLQAFELSSDEKAEIPKLLKPIVDNYIKRVTLNRLPGEKIVQDVYVLKEKYSKRHKQ